MSNLSSALTNSGAFDYADPNETAAGLLQAARDIQYRVDPETAAFPRVAKLASDKTISWNIPGTEIKEVPQDIIAVRGVIVEPKFGFRLFDSEQRRSVCNTTSLELPSGLKVENSMPMPLAVYSPQKYGTSQPADAVLKWNLMGSRGESCSQCVSAGRNVQSYTDAQGTKHTDSCGLNSKVLFYVTQVGIRKYSAVTRTSTVTWVNVVDLKDGDDNPLYATPFILNMQISRMPVTKAIGANLQVKTIINGGEAPEGSQTLQSFLTTMHSSGQVVATRSGKLIYRACVEVYLAQPTDAFAKSLSAMIKSIPVFCHTNEPIDSGELEQMLVLAHQQYEQDLHAVGGNSSAVIAPPADAKPRFTVTAQQPTTESAAVEVEVESIEDEALPTLFHRQVP